MKPLIYGLLVILVLDMITKFIHALLKISLKYTTDKDLPYTLALFCAFVLLAGFLSIAYVVGRITLAVGLF